MTRTSAEVLQEMAAGERLAANIKNFFFAEEAWTPKVAFKVGYKMRDIKQVARKCFVDQDIYSILALLKDFSKEDLEDLLGMVK